MTSKQPSASTIVPLGNGIIGEEDNRSERMTPSDAASASASTEDLKIPDKPNSGPVSAGLVNGTNFTPLLRTQTPREFRTTFIRYLNRFADSKDEVLELPPMQKNYRKICHQLCQSRKGIKSTSKGNGDKRHTVLVKTIRKVKAARRNSKMIDFRINDKQLFEVHEFLNTYPVKEQDVVKFFDTHYKSHKTHRGGSNVLYHNSDNNLVPKTPKAVNGNIKAFCDQLPVRAMKTEIMDAIKNNNVILITGGTGCGKTTQVPQFILEEATQANQRIRIVCTQPRRLPAITVAERVARERGEAVGGTVGYHVRLNQKVNPKETILTYCTSGILLRMLTVDRLASKISHVILDEVHEREQNTDYLLIALREAVKQRTDLKVILMSATMEGNRELFMDYFKDSKIVHIQIPTRLFGVEKYHIADIMAMSGFMRPGINEYPPEDPTEDVPFNPNELPDLPAWPATLGWKDSRNILNHVSSLVVDPPAAFSDAYAKSVQALPIPRKHYKAIYDADYFQHCTDNGIPEMAVDLALAQHVITFLIDSELTGSILVFLPGYDDITQLYDRLVSRSDVTRLKPRIYTLHSQMDSSDQNKIFEKIDESQERKVILSTNIAEASLTIDDVIFVVDTGRVKEKTYEHESRISALKLVWIAKSNAEQRAGRAGRCRNGYCFRLFSEEEYEAMLETQVAEMKRTAIHEVCLHTKIFAPDNMSIKTFLGNAPDPPDLNVIESSIQFLIQLGALSYPIISTGVEKSVEPDLTAEPDITELGLILAHLPMDPQLARLLLFGIALQCFDPIVTLVASLSHRDPFILPLREERERANAVREDFSKLDLSDHLMLIRAYNGYASCRRARSFTTKYYISPSSMRMIDGIRQQIFYEVKSLHLLPSNAHGPDDIMINAYSTSWPMIQAAVVAGCYPCVATGNCKHVVKTASMSRASIHPGSSVRRQLQKGYNGLKSKADPKFMVFQESVMADRPMLRTVTAITPLHTVMFAGSLHLEHIPIYDYDPSRKRKPNGDLIMSEMTGAFDLVLDSFLTFSADFSTLNHLMKLRFKFMKYFITLITSRNARTGREEAALLACINTILSFEHDEQCLLMVNDLPGPSLQNCLATRQLYLRGRNFQPGMSPLGAGSRPGALYQPQPISPMQPGGRTFYARQPGQRQVLIPELPMDEDGLPIVDGALDGISIAEEDSFMSSGDDDSEEPTWT